MILIHHLEDMYSAIYMQVSCVLQPYDLSVMLPIIPLDSPIMPTSKVFPGMQQYTGRPTPKYIDHWRHEYLIVPK